MQTALAPTVLITRPEPQASRLAAALEGKARVVVSPLMQRVFLPVQVPAGPFEALVLTSETGAEAAARLRAVGQRLPDRAFCVGERTAAAARAAGLAAEVAGRDAEALIRTLAGKRPGRLLYLRGRDVAADLPTTLAGRGVAVAELAVYAQEPAALSDEARRLLMRPGAVLVPLFSARSGRLLLAACPDGMQARLVVCAISAAVLEALPEDWRGAARLAETPDGPGMQAAILRGISSLLP